MSTAEPPSTFDRVLRVARSIEDGILVLLLAAMIGIAVTQIVLRNFFASGILWADPLLRMLVLWVGLVGAMVATRQDKHIAVDVLTRWLAPGARHATRVVVELFTSLVAALLAYHGARFMLMDLDAGTTAFGNVPTWVTELIIPVAFAVIAVRYLIFAFIHARELLRGTPTP